MSATLDPHLQAINSVLSGPEERSDAEERWVSFQPYLESKGYRLRSRYRSSWVPSWTITGADPRDCEDSPDLLPIRTLDAARVEDELQVIVKILTPSDNDREGEQELQILQHFSSPPYRNDPNNHIVPCLDSFPVPDVQGGMFFVMPLLSDFQNPPFYNLSEIHDFLTQIFEGLEYLHTHNVAHGDIAADNILMDKRPLYNEPFHPFQQHRSLDRQRILRPKYTRSQKSVRYYYIDFGYSTWFKDPASPRTVTGVNARERAPEQTPGATYDPFKVDIYQLGALIRRSLIPKYEPLNFLLPLARDMTQADPRERPTLQLAQRAMHTHFAGISSWRSRWPLISPDASFRQRFVLFAAGLTAEAVLFLKSILSFLFQC